MTYDFCGYATRNNVKCSDGRIILKDAFREDDGKKVPLVWNHQHNSPDTVLGHAILENRDDGVYAYASFNDTDSGQRAKELVRHGDVNALSIYANKLRETAGRVMHGVIREVSLVYAGANPEARIDSFISHGDGDDVTEDRSQGWFYSGMEGELYHADSEDKNDSEEEGKATENEEESEETAEPEKDMAHADEKEPDDFDSILDTFTDKQKAVVMSMIDYVLEQAGKNTKSDKETTKDDDNDDEDKDEDEEESDMKHNAFDTELTENDNVLSHSDEKKILDMARTASIGTLKGAIKAFCEDAELAHGFDSQSLTLLFPEYKDVKPGAPEMLTTDQGWITKVLNKVHKSPLTHIRVRQADVRDITNLRAKGYGTKGTQKALTGDISMLYRTTDPQTVYVRSDLHRDDVLDIQDFDYVAYMYNIDRMDLNEELATAIMLGDGRAVSDQYKIKEDKIIPIWTDAELYTIHRTVDVAAMKASLQGTTTASYFGDNFVYAEAFVQELLYGREDAKNVGAADLYIAPHMLNLMLLARDRNGRRIYNTVEELRSALNVREIVTVEQFEGKSRSVTETVEGTSTTVTKNLLAILVDLSNYQLGAAKGGEITHFTDFDINFNTLQSLLETRTSGMNTRPLSALVLEQDA